MKIAIDANPIFGLRAIKRYALNLIEELAKIDKQNEYLTFFIAFRQNLDKIPDYFNYPKFSKVVSRLPGKVLNFLWDNFNQPKGELWIKNADIFHCTDSDFPPFKKTKTIATIHGLHHLVVPQYFNKMFVQAKTKVYRQTFKRADYFIAVSENIKKEAVNFLSLPAEKIKVIPLGVEKEFKKIEIEKNKWEEFKSRYKITKPFLLFVSAVQPNKNVTGLIEAFQLIINEEKLDLQLVIIGHLDPDYSYYIKEVKDKILNYKLYEDVIITNYLQKDEDLLIFYNKATAFVFPTIYEGWTSPPLEAMKCGCPVITSNISSLPETVNDAALKVNPNSPEEIASAVKKILNDTELKNNLIAKGLQWANKFTWEKMAQEHLSYYEEIYKIT